MQVPLLRNSERVDFRRCLVETCDKTKIVARGIRSIRGSASNFNCVDCGNIASEWSHIHNTDHNDVNNYQSRCRKCHVKYDDNPPPKSKKCKLGCLCGKHGDLNYA